MLPKERTISPKDEFTRLESSKGSYTAKFSVDEDCNPDALEEAVKGLRVILPEDYQVAIYWADEKPRYVLLSRDFEAEGVKAELELTRDRVEHYAPLVRSSIEIAESQER